MPNERHPPMQSWLLPAPTTFRDREGDERFLGRRLGVHIDGHFYCADHHHHKHAFPRSEDTIRCPHRDCGRFYFVLGHAMMADDTPITIATEITLDEWKRIRRMNGRRVLEYLGVTWSLPTRAPAA